MRTSSTRQFSQAWATARTESSPQGAKVTKAELAQALKAVTANGKVSRAEARVFADAMEQGAVMTRDAATDARAFLATVASSRTLDVNSRTAAIKADFAVCAARPLRALAVPGRVITNLEPLARGLKFSVWHLNEQPWDKVEVRKATLAGQPVYVVHASGYLNQADVEKVQLFSATSGEYLAEGQVDDPMLGFKWS